MCNLHITVLQFLLTDHSNALHALHDQEIRLDLEKRFHLFLYLNSLFHLSLIFIMSYIHLRDFFFRLKKKKLTILITSDKF